MAHDTAVGIDLGATKIAAILLERNGNVVAEAQLPTKPERSAGAVLDDIASLASELIEKSKARVSGIGVGFPGRVNVDIGSVTHAVNLGWDIQNIYAELQARLGPQTPIVIGKDANLSALGERILGAAQDCDHFVYLGVGSGLGAGIFSAGRMLTGSSWDAANIGHLSIDPEGPLCNCGLRGCSEIFVSGPGLVRLVKSWLAQRQYPSRLNLDDPPSTVMILEAARSGDALAKAAIEQIGCNLGIVMASCAIVLNPQRFILGGGLGLAAFEWLAPAARKELDRRTLASIAQQITIVPSQVRSSAVGAACLAWSGDTGDISQN